MCCCAGTSQTVQGIQYDGYGNRVEEAVGSQTYTYTYDAANRVTNSSTGEQWGYDAVGNQTFHRDTGGVTVNSGYDAQNRVNYQQSSANPDRFTQMFYDGAGNLATTRNHGDGWSYDDVTTRNVQYREVSKDIRNSSGKGVNFSGHTSFSYDVNGNLVFFDRGRYRNEFTGQSGTRNSVASLTYDNDSQILTRAEVHPSDMAPSFFEGSVNDPQGSARWNQLNSSIAGSFKMGSYFYGQGHPLADQSADQVRTLTKLTLTGATPVIDAPQIHPYAKRFLGEGGVAPVYGITFNFTIAAGDIITNTGDPLTDRAATLRNIATRAYPSFAGLDADSQVAILSDMDTRLPPTHTAGDVVSLLGSVVGHRLTLQSSDIVTDGQGNLDCQATAQAIATRAYSGFAGLSAANQTRVVNYIAAQLPANDGVVVAGVVLSLHGYITVVEITAYQNANFSVEDHYRRIGDGTSLGSAQEYVVRNGDTLQGIAGSFYGSSAYWYLIADANQLEGTEELKPGMALTIPNATTSSLNPADAYSVYNESDVIGCGTLPRSGLEACVMAAGRGRLVSALHGMNKNTAALSALLRRLEVLTAANTRGSAP